MCLCFRALPTAAIDAIGTMRGFGVAISVMGCVSHRRIGIGAVQWKSSGILVATEASSTHRPSGFGGVGLDLSCLRGVRCVFLVSVREMLRRRYRRCWLWRLWSRLAEKSMLDTRKWRTIPSPPFTSGIPFACSFSSCSSLLFPLLLSELSLSVVLRNCSSQVLPALRRLRHLFSIAGRQASGDIGGTRRCPLTLQRLSTAVQTSVSTTRQCERFILIAIFSDTLP